MASFMDRLLGGTDEPTDEAESEASMSDESPAAVARELDAAPEEPGPEGTLELDDIRSRIDELETSIERNESSMRSVQSSQEDMTQRLEEMSETIRQLLGVYEQVTARDNPFVPSTETSGATGDGDGGRFGVVSKVGTDGHPGGDGDGATADDDGDRVSFDDLLAADAEQSADGFDEPSARTERDEPLDDGHGGATRASSEPVVEQERADTETGLPGSADEMTPLRSLPEGYAADAIVLEWLSTLVTSSGPGGAMKAIAFYAEVGWIADEVRTALEEYLSGPGLDVHVDPNCPVDLTADDHAQSYEYLLRLDALEGITADFGDRA